MRSQGTHKSKVGTREREEREERKREGEGREKEREREKEKGEWGEGRLSVSFVGNFWVLTQQHVPRAVVNYKGIL